MSHFRRAAHRRFADMRRGRGRLLLQLAMVAHAERRELEQNGWRVGQAAYLYGLADDLAAAAARFDVVGGTRAAFADVFQRARGLPARESLVQRVQAAIEAVPELSAAGVTVAYCGERVVAGTAIRVYSVAGARWATDRHYDARAAAELFVGERGAGEAAAEAALLALADAAPVTVRRAFAKAG